MVSIIEYKSSIKPRRKGIGEEDRMHIQFGSLLQKYEKMGKMPNVIVWTYLPMGELRKKSTASMLKKKGVKSGWADYIFLVYNPKGHVDIKFLEFKTESGKQQESQKNFELSFAGSSNSSYCIIRSVEGAIKILEQEGVIK